MYHIDSSLSRSTAASHDSQLDMDQDYQDSQACSHADQASATCHLCRKHVRAKRISAVKCITCGAQSHVSYIVKNFASTNNGALKTSHQWLTDFLRVANFHFVYSACASAGVNPASEFPVKQQLAITNSKCLSKQQDISQLFTSFDSLRQQVDGMGQSIDALQKVMLNKLDSVNIFATAIPEAVIAEGIKKE